jgi:hypothetical protein
MRTTEAQRTAPPAPRATEAQPDERRMTKIV